MKEKGVINVFILVAAVGLMAFLFIASVTSFRDGAFQALYPKSNSFASETISEPVSLIPGDINQNGRVDVFDFNLLITDFGGTDEASLRSDINGNGRVDVFDFNILVQNFGQSTG